MANELTQTKKATPVAALTAMLNADTVKKQFANAIGKNADTFTASLIELTTSDANLQKCAPATLVTEALRAATLHLPLNKSLGYAYLVPFFNSVKQADGSWIKVPTPTMVIGYKGLIQLALRTGQYRTINADVVYKGELQRVDKLSGSINFDGEKESDEVVGYFCYFELLNGFRKTLYMSVDDMAAYAKKYSPSVPKNTTAEDLKKLAGKVAQSKSVGWLGNFDEMALKTVTRRLIGKYGYLSIEMQNALDTESKREAEAERNDVISQAANKTMVNLDTTGEVKEAVPVSDEESGKPQKATAEAPADDMPY